MKELYPKLWHYAAWLLISVAVIIGIVACTNFVTYHMHHMFLEQNHTYNNVP